MTETYALDEAKQELARRECRYHGHTWTVIEAFGKGPVHTICERCGESHAVEQDRG